MDEETLIDVSPDVMDAPAQMRAVVIVMGGDRIVTRHEIRTREIVIGRARDCDIVLPGTVASRRHAKIEHHNLDRPLEHPDVSVRDLGSTNGTYVNGERIGTRKLQSGDRILVGKKRLDFVVWDDAKLRAEQDLLNNARVDALTGLLNRASFDDRIAGEFLRSQRDGSVHSLVLVDLDHFKRLNDTHGHHAGDEVLRAIGRLVLKACRRTDFACRYGGEEIAIVCRDTNRKGAQTLAERILAETRKQVVLAAGATIRVTASAGVAELEPWMRGAEDFIKTADLALYQAKRQGRDRVCENVPFDEDNANTLPLP